MYTIILKIGTILKRIHSSLGYKTPLEKKIELRAYYKLAA